MGKEKSQGLRQSVNISKRTMVIAAVFLFAFAGLIGSQMYESESKSTEFNRNDVMFMNMMIVHHDQAIEMADLAENRTNNSKILELSENISKAQRAENSQMREWMNNLGYNPGNHHRMAGMASRMEMQRLENSKNSEFDRMFAELMIEHHEGGIEMARSFREDGRHTELKEMQTKMIETQEREIKKMRKWQNQGF